METGLLIAYVSLGLMAVLPIYTGSGVLFGFYLLFTYFSKEYINYLLTAYFALFGIGSLGTILNGLFVRFVPSQVVQWGAHHLLLERSDKAQSLIDLQITWALAASYALASIFTAVYVYTKHWVASNMFSLAFAHTAISMIHLDSFYTGICLLAGLFFYDIFWVFGTNVMVKVAKSFDVPVKLLFPKNIFTSANSDFALLGLGDIVIPGVFIALCLRFDEHIRSRNKAYFRACFMAYILGLACTIFVMHTFKAAQPALLYLSPACSLSAVAVAVFKGQLNAFFEYSTEEKGSAGTKEKSPTKKASKKD